MRSSRFSILQVEALEVRTNPVDLRVVNYNIAGSDGTVREGLVGNLMDASTANDHGILDTIGVQTTAGLTRPADIILLQETSDTNLSTVQTVASQLNAYYGAGTYAAGTKLGTSTGSGTQGIVYRTGTVNLIAEAALGTTSTSGAARQDLRYTIRPVGTTTDVYIYNMHLKANSAAADAQRRLVEVNALRADSNALGATANILYVGDFNFYGSGTSEPAYAAFLSAAGGSGQAADVGDTSHSWTRSSNAWKSIYTQAPSSAPPAGFTGGGLDDRFDFILPSTDLNDGNGAEYRAGSYHTFGNNGTTVLNGSVNVPNNNVNNSSLTNTPLTVAEQQAVLSYLTTVTDHLPVVADFNIPTPGVLQFSMSAVSVNETAGSATITVTRTGGSDGSVNAAYAAVAGTAMANQDFTPVSGTVSFVAGQTIATFTVPITDDAYNEPTETIQLSLATPNGGATLGTPTTSTLSIVDNDILVVSNVAVNSGATQRSRVTSIAVTFNASVTLAAYAFTLTRPVFLPTSSVAATLVSGTPMTGQGRIAVSTSIVGGVTVATLTFATISGATNAIGNGVEYGSLSDGSWVLTVTNTAVMGPVGTLQTSFVSPSTGSAGQGRIFRLFGDNDGDGDVDSINAAQVRTTFLLMSTDAFFNAAYDFDGDGDVDSQDLARFRQRFLLTV